MTAWTGIKRTSLTLNGCSPRPGEVIQPCKVGARLPQHTRTVSDIVELPGSHPQRLHTVEHTAYPCPLPKDSSKFNSCFLAQNNKKTTNHTGQTTKPRLEFLCSGSAPVVAFFHCSLSAACLPFSRPEYGASSWLAGTHSLSFSLTLSHS